ncbi:multidrug efflux protein [compost metagenome]
MITIGTGIKVAYSIGEEKWERAKTYIHNGFLITAIVGILYMLFIFICKNQRIGFFELADHEVEKMAIQFLVTVNVHFKYSPLDFL